jgi:hypothetical protein
MIFQLTLTAAISTLMITIFISFITLIFADAAFRADISFDYFSWPPLAFIFDIDYCHYFLLHFFVIIIDTELASYIIVIVG